MEKKVVIAGGTGFIGTFIESKFKDLGYNVKIISRNSHHISWNNHDAIIKALENAELLINLAGRSVDCRYTEKNKEEILHSRIKKQKC